MIDATKDLRLCLVWGEGSQLIWLFSLLTTFGIITLGFFPPPPRDKEFNVQNAFVRYAFVYIFQLAVMPVPPFGG
jgi:hypothetical protein